MSVIDPTVAAERSRLLPPNSIRDRADCLAAVERAGFVWPFTPGNGLLPSLFPALAAENEHQRWEWMWGWKDQIAASRAAFYGKVVGGKPTFVSLAWLPKFYALTGNTGDLEDDLVHLGESVRLQESARNVCRYLLENGPTGTRTLLAKLTDGSREGKKALEKGLEQLDTGMIIAKCGTEPNYSLANVWDLFARFLPEAADEGTAIPTREAALLLLRQYFQLTPVVARKSLSGLFPWNEAHQARALVKLEEAGELTPCHIAGKPALRRADLPLTP